MKRLFSVTLLIVLLIPLVLPCFANPVFAASEEMNVYVEYMEFYNNQQHYIDLAIEDGYTIIVNVGEEYMDLERERIAQKSTTAAERISTVQPYGLSAPTEPWVCARFNACTFEGHNSQSAIYTNYYVTGSLAYIVSVTNLYDGIDMSYVPHGSISSVTSVDVPAATTVIKYFGTSSTSSKFYLSFPAPAYFEGYMDCIAE